LHPNASRVARRAPLPTLVFNLHEQFERLRADGRFPRMRDAIRRRDKDLQGSLNPMVTDHGQASEARQYSGRAVPSDWSPPFAPAAGSAEPCCAAAPLVPDDDTAPSEPNSVALQRIPDDVTPPSDDDVATEAQGDR
ncbi:MAG: YqcI/YcgG family protein, partial [Dermatophilaceae bacterium]